jgi:hypothetical protein
MAERHRQGRAATNPEETACAASRRLGAAGGRKCSNSGERDPARRITMLPLDWKVALRTVMLQRVVAAVCLDLCRGGHL